MTKTVPIIYMEADGTEKEVQAEIAKNLLEVAHENNVELEGKAYDFMILLLFLFTDRCLATVKLGDWFP